MQTEFNDLVEQHLGARLPQQLATSVDLPKLPPDTQAFIERMLVLMKRAGYGVEQFNTALIRWLSVTIPTMLPRAWGGRIPPITLPGRHQKLDAYVAGEYAPPFDSSPLFVDIGCGFPPVTPAESARALPDWQVYGVDRSFADFVLYDPAGHYACFDQAGGFQYFQASMDPSGRALYEDPAGTRQRFEALYADLAPQLPQSDGTVSQQIEKDGCKLIQHHIRDFESNNLTLIKEDLLQLDLPPATVIRCMNLLIYFEPQSRKTMLSHAAKLLADDGMLIAGTNGYGIQTRYAVYRKDNDSLYPSEFAFSLDNLGHIVFMPWFSMHDNDPEAMLLADLAGAIRSDRQFWPSFSGHLDELLKAQKICFRGPDGFLQPLVEEMSLTEYFQKNAAIWQQLVEDGYPARTVEVLERAGHKAWINAVGDIAIVPPADALPTG
ncbi:MAG: CheR family methyltransferase [Desulfobacterales bacterium]|nr:CheR family methyltransferase [Desulfobacterales bacterium]